MSRTRRCTAAALAALLALAPTAVASAATIPAQHPTRDKSDDDKRDGSDVQKDASRNDPDDDTADTDPVDDRGRSDRPDPDQTDDLTEDDGDDDVEHDDSNTTVDADNASSDHDDRRDASNGTGKSDAPRTDDSADRDLRRLVAALDHFARRIERLAPSPARDALAVALTALRAELDERSLTPRAAKVQVERLLHRLEDLHDEDHGDETLTSPSRQEGRPAADDPAERAREMISAATEKMLRYTQAGSAQRAEMEQRVTAATMALTAEPLDRPALRAALRAMQATLDAVRDARRAAVQRRAADAVGAEITRIEIEDLEAGARAALLARLNGVLDIIDTLDPASASAAALQAALTSAREATLDAARAAIAEQLRRLDTDRPNRQERLDAALAAVAVATTVADLRAVVVAFRAS